MTIDIKPSTVAASIAGLSVSGVTIKSIDSIPQSGQMLCPIMFPQPDGFITDITSERTTFGSNGNGDKIDFSYNLHYVFLFAEYGGLAAYDYYSPLLAKLELIFEKMQGSDTLTGLVDLNLNSLDALGVIEDPSGNQFWGALFTLHCLEYVNNA